MISRKLLKISMLLITLILFLVFFIAIFGKDNIIVAIFLILLAVMMLSRDLTRNPFKNLIALILLNLILAIGAFISYLMPILGFVIIFLIVFSITYVIMHNLKNPMYFPFILGFLFLLSKPVDFNQLAVRLISLIVGSIFIVGLNIVVNKNKFSNSIKNDFISILKDIEKAVNYKLEGKEIDQKDIRNSFDLIKRQLNTRLKENYFSKPIYTTVLNVTISLEQIGLIIMGSDLSKDDLLKLKSLVNQIKDNLKDIKKARMIINKFVEDNPTFKAGIIYNLKIISYELGNPGEDKYNVSEIPSRFRVLTLLKEDLSVNSVKFTFAFKLAISISLIEFIGFYFHVPNVKWIGYTILAILQPCLDNTYKKAELRIKGTVFGIILFMILDDLFFMKTGLFYFRLAHTIAIVLCIFGFSYVLTNLHKYDVQVIFTTIISLLIAESTTGGKGILTERFVYIVIGCVFALIMNYMVFPTTLKKENTNLVKRYHEINLLEIKNIKAAILNQLDENQNTMLILKANIIKDTIAKNNKADEDKQIAEILKLENIITSLSTLLINLVKTDSISDKTRKLAIDYIEKSDKSKNEYVESLEELNKLEDKTEKLLKTL